MEVKFYNVFDDNNVVNKTLHDEYVLNVELKSPSNISNLMITLGDNTALNRNYVYIPFFKRYYYIDDVKILNNGLITLLLSVDVLKSYSEEIYNSYVYDRGKKVITLKSNEKLTLEPKIISVIRGDIK